MGTGKSYKKEGGFETYTYESVTEKIIVNGVAGHIIKSKQDKDGFHTSLPMYSNTSDM